MGRRGWSKARRSSWLPVAVLVLWTAACGTVLPNSRFQATGTQVSPVTSNGASPAPGSTASPGPTSTGTATTGPGSRPTQGVSARPGQTVTVGGRTTGPSSGPASSNCPGTLNNDPSIGVTPTAIRVGIMYSGPANPFAPNQFDVSYYGANSYFSYIDQAGGVCGRQIQVFKCDDNGDSNADVNCAHTLIDQDHVLALAGSNVFEYSGAPYVSAQGVPDVGGEPISGNAYYTYRHLYAIIGSWYQNNDTPPPAYWAGYNLGVWFKNHLHLSRAGVIYYAQTDSQRGAHVLEGYLTHAGIRVDEEEVPLAGDPGPNVLDMQKKGDQAVFDALDSTGNQKVCQAMQNYSYAVPKISTTSTWIQQFGQIMSGYQCMNDYYSWGFETNYADTSNPQVALFRQAYQAFAPGAPLAQWSLEGWVAAMFFTDALRSCGATVTRSCIESFVNTPTGYGAHGLIDPHTLRFPHYSSQPATLTQCYTIVKWAGGASGTWGTVIDHSADCGTTPSFAYTG